MELATPRRQAGAAYSFRRSTVSEVEVRTTVKDEGHYRIDGEILKNELQKWNQHPRKPRVPAISSSISSFNLQKGGDQVQILREFELYLLKRDNSIKLACENF